MPEVIPVPKPHPSEKVTPRRAWSLPARIAFRFAFCYWLLYCMPANGRSSIFGALPGGDFLATPYLRFWHSITPWTAIHLFRLSGQRVTYFPTGSGDTTLDYVQVFLFLVVAAVVALAWSLLDRKRRDYRTLDAWLRIFVRFTLSLALFTYGLAKVIPTQFRPPSLGQLSETYGEASPMGILWTFMGASMAYTIFSGLAELSAGLLLLFRKTALLGSLAAAAVLLNVVMLNFCYDVPVKLYSTHLLLMALFLALPDIPRLARIFLLNKPAEAADLSQPFPTKRWMRITASLLKFAIALNCLGMNFWGGWQFLQQKRAEADPPLYGVFQVDSSSRNGKDIHDDPKHWTRIIGERGYWALKQADGTTVYTQPRFLPHTNTIDATIHRTESHLILNYQRPDAQHLVLSGKVNNDSIEIHLHRIDASSYPLTTRGFHWISEFPFNR